MEKASTDTGGTAAGRYYRLALWLCAAMGAGLLVYTVYRAATLSFTHDESLTYNWFYHRSYAEVFLMELQVSANNHILNTWLMKVSGNLFGPSELALRLPNLLGHVLYLFSSLMILRRLKAPLLMVAGFILLNFNPYLLDFFSLARGYGLSLGLMLFSAWLALEYYRGGGVLWFTAALLPACMAALASFVMLHFIVAIWLLAVLAVWARVQGLWAFIKKFFLHHFLHLALTAAFLNWLYPTIQRLILYNEFYYGGTTGFWQDTVKSLGLATAYSQPYMGLLMDVFYNFSLFTFGAGAVVLVLSLFRPRLLPGLYQFRAVYLLLLVPAVGIVLQHYVAGAHYLIYRTALLFWPLTGLAFIFLLHSLSGRAPYPVAGAFTALLALGLVWHFGQAANVQRYNDWQYDAPTKNMLRIVEKLHPNAPDTSVSIGMTWVFEPSINYYRETKGLHWLKPATRDGVEGEYDYYYIMPQDTANLPEGHRRLIEKFEGSGNLLLR